MLNSLNLKKFDMSWVENTNKVVMIGMTGSGKSWLIQDLMFYHRDIPVGIVISGTEPANQFYSKMVPPLFIYDEYIPEVIDSFMERQSNAVKRNWANPNAFLIMDDCLYDNAWTKAKHTRNIFMTGRHWKILYILAMQYPLGIPTMLRGNIDYVFILRESNYKNRKRIYENYAGIFPTFDMFCKVLDSCTQNYECLVLHISSKSGKLEDQVFFYKAMQHGDFKVGCAEYWKHHINNYDYKQNITTERDNNVVEVKSKMKGNHLTIKKSY